LHNFDREGVSAIAHADITLGQFISVNGTIKLNDFNRARFIAWNQTSDQPCPYSILNNPGIMRSPEEYKYEPQTEKVSLRVALEKLTSTALYSYNNYALLTHISFYALIQVDVYSFGNVLYVLLMLEWPFYDIDYEEEEDGDDDDDRIAFIVDQILQGRRPSIPDNIWNSSNAIERALVMAIRMCLVPDPIKRASARQVETYLVSQLKKIDPVWASSRNVGSVSRLV
jgi:serine/threonine protein kinase